MRRAVEHRALMAIAIGDLRVANTSTIAVAALERGWMLYAHTPDARNPDQRMRGSDTRRPRVGIAARCCTTTRSPTVTSAVRRSPSMTAACASAASAAPSTAPPTSSSNRTSPNSW